MLPAWATVLIALSASVVGGVVGALWPTRMRIKHEREEQLRDRLLAAADDFSTGMGQALAALHEARIAAYTGDNATELAEAERLVAEAYARVARVSLLFGDESGAGEAASAGVAIARQALVALRKDARADFDLSFRRAHELHVQFNRGALRLIHEPELARPGAGGPISLDETLARLGVG